MRVLAGLVDGEEKDSRPSTNKIHKSEMDEARGNGTSIFDDDVVARDDLLYSGRKMTDPINTAEVGFEPFLFP